MKQRAKAIQEKCETLLISVHRKANQFQQPEEIRWDYIQYLAQRVHQVTDEKRALEQLVDRVERMQCDLYQRLGTRTRDARHAAFGFSSA